jgi:hypothetical protein
VEVNGTCCFSVATNDSGDFPLYSTSDTTVHRLTSWAFYVTGTALTSTSQQFLSDSGSLRISPFFFLDCDSSLLFLGLDSTPLWLRERSLATYRLFSTELQSLAYYCGGSSLACSFSFVLARDIS